MRHDFLLPDIFKGVGCLVAGAGLSAIAGGWLGLAGTAGALVGLGLLIVTVRR